MANNKQRINKIVLYSISLCLLLFFAIIVGFDIFSNPTKLKNFILSFGIFAPVVFFSLQVLQVIIAPIPGNILALVGGVLFGTVKGTLLNLTSLYLGSFIMFAIGKHFAKKVALVFVKEETYSHYKQIISGKKGKLSLFLLFLLPFFPDDALCLIAGSSNLSYKEFGVFLVIARTPGMLFAGVLGSKISTGNCKLIIAISLVYGIILLLIYLYRKKLIKDDTIEK